MGDQEERKAFMDFMDSLKPAIGAVVELWCTLVDRVVESIRERTEVERQKVSVMAIIGEKTIEIEKQKLAFWKEHEFKYEARTMEIENIARRLGELVEKEFHTVR